jgi:hypothetical protein
VLEPQEVRTVRRLTASRRRLEWRASRGKYADCGGVKPRMVGEEVCGKAPAEMCSTKMSL